MKPKHTQLSFLSGIQWFFISSETFHHESTKKRGVIINCHEKNGQTHKGTQYIYLIKDMTSKIMIQVDGWMDGQIWKV